MDESAPSSEVDVNWMTNSIFKLQALYQKLATHQPSPDITMALQVKKLERTLADLDRSFGLLTLQCRESREHLETIHVLSAQHQAAIDTMMARLDSVRSLAYLCKENNERFMTLSVQSDEQENRIESLSRRVEALELLAGGQTRESIPYGAAIPPPDSPPVPRRGSSAPAHQPQHPICLASDPVTFPGSRFTLLPSPASLDDRCFPGPPWTLQLIKAIPLEAIVGAEQAVS